MFRKLMLAGIIGLLIASCKKTAPEPDPVAVNPGPNPACSIMIPITNIYPDCAEWCCFENQRIRLNTVALNYYARDVVGARCYVPNKVHPPANLYWNAKVCH